MKLSCNVIRDLLPLYQDEICSEESRMLVAEHLAECAECRAILDEFKMPEDGLLPEKEVPAGEEAKRIQRSFHKIKRRWMLSLVAVLLILPVVYAGIMGYHEYVGEGLCFTNLDEVLMCRRFFRLLEEQNYEQAAAMIDFGDSYQSIKAFLEGGVEEEAFVWYDKIYDNKEEAYAWYEKYYGYTPDISEEEYVQRQQAAFVEFMETNHVLLQQARYSWAYRTDSEWVVEYIVTENVVNMDGSNRIFEVGIVCRDGKLLITSASANRWETGPSFLDMFFRKFE